MVDECGKGYGCERLHNIYILFDLFFQATVVIRMGRYSLQT